MKQILILALVAVLAGCAADGSFRAAVDELDTRAPEQAADAEDGTSDEEATSDAETQPEPEVDPEEAPEPEPAAEPAPEPEPEPEAAPGPRTLDPNAETRAACERRGGTFTKTPTGNFVCVNFTGEGRKQCSSPNQCTGGCLARSQTCSPVTPLIGCHQLITASGGMATVCVD